MVQETSGQLFPSSTICRLVPHHRGCAWIRACLCLRFVSNRGLGLRRCIDSYLWLPACRWARVAFEGALDAALPLARPIPQHIRRHSEESSKTKRRPWIHLSTSPDSHQTPIDGCREGCNVPELVLLDGPRTFRSASFTGRITRPTYHKRQKLPSSIHVGQGMVRVLHLGSPAQTPCKCLNGPFRGATLNYRPWCRVSVHGT
jgi:hypothetical protein